MEFAKYHSHIKQSAKSEVLPVLASMISGATAAGLSLMLPFLVGYLVVQINQNSTDLQSILIWIPILLCLIILLRAITTEISARSFDRLDNKLKLILYEHALDARMALHRTKDPGEFISEMNNDVFRTAQLFSSLIPGFITACIYTIGSLWGIYHFYPLMMVACVVILLMAGIVSVWRSRKFSGVSHTLLEQYSQSYALIESSLYQIIITKSYQLQSFFESRVEILFRNIVDGKKIERMQRLGLSVCVQILGVALLGICAWIVVGYVDRDKLSLDKILPATLFVLVILRHSGHLADLIGSFRQSQAAVIRLGNMLDTPVESQAGDHNSTIPAIHSPSKSILIKDLSFGYKPDEYVINHLTLSVSPGSKVLIVGPNGSGKTTLLNLMLRFDQPPNGSLYWGEKDWLDFELGVIRKAIALVPQANLFEKQSIRDNLRYGNLNATESELQSVIKTVGLDHLVRSLPDGMDTLIGSRAMQISGGQAQRVAIARILLKKEASIYLFDEPMQLLDPVTSRQLIKDILTILKEKTLFVVSHDLSISDEFDVVLDMGKYSRINT